MQASSRHCRLGHGRPTMDGMATICVAAALAQGRPLAHAMLMCGRLENGAWQPGEGDGEQP